MSIEEKDKVIQDLQEENAKLDKDMYKLSKRNKKLENDLAEALKNLEIAEAEKAEKAAYKQSDYDIYQTGVSAVYENKAKREPKKYGGFVGHQR